MRVMAEPIPSEELVLQPNAMWLFVGAVFFGVCGALCLYGGHLVGWVAMAFSIVFLLLLLSMAFSSHSRLRLCRDGFTFGTLQRISTYRWTDVERFFTARFASSHRVGFAFAPHCRQEPPIRWLQPPLYGRFLPNDYGMSATELAALMESWRARYADAHEANKTLEPTPGSAWGWPGSHGLSIVIGAAWLSSGVSPLRTSCPSSHPFSSSGPST